MTFEDLISSHTIYKSTHTSSQNDFGEMEHTYTDGTTPISCRINPLSNAERIDTTGIFDNVRYKAYMAADEDISRGDRVTYSSELYRVREVMIDSSSHHKTAFLELLT